MLEFIVHQTLIEHNEALQLLPAVTCVTILQYTLSIIFRLVQTI